MKKFIVAALAAIALALPMTARAVTTSPAPLHVTGCTVDYVEQDIVGTTQYLTNGVTVTVKNTSDKAIASFSGGGMYNHQTILDSITHPIPAGGTYSFTKHYQAFAYNGSMAACFVSKVTFADGTTWTAPPM